VGQLEYSRCLIIDLHRPGQLRFSTSNVACETESPPRDAPIYDGWEAVPLNRITAMLEQQQGRPSREEAPARTLRLVGRADETDDLHGD
jgi:hypothetical protein